LIYVNKNKERPNKKQLLFALLFHNVIPLQQNHCNVTIGRSLFKH